MEYFLTGTYYTQLRSGDMPSSTSVMKRSHSSPNIAQVRMFILLNWNVHVDVNIMALMTAAIKIYFPVNLSCFGPKTSLKGNCIQMKGIFHRCHI